MKSYGSILEFTRERNDDLMKAFRRHIADAPHIVLTEIFARVASSPAARFWVSEERASLVIAAMDAGRPLPRMRYMKREMYNEIYRRFLIERKKLPQKSLFQIVSLIVNQPAPQFYLTPRTVGEYITRIKDGWYDRQLERYRRYPCGEQKAQ